MASQQATNKELYANRKAEAWAHMANEFRNGRVTLTWEDSELARQLTSVRWRTSDGKMGVELKEHTRQRLGRSPDRADAYVMGVWAVRNAEKISLSQSDEEAQGEMERLRRYGRWAGGESVMAQ